MLKMLDLFSGVGVGVAAQAVGGIEEYGVEIMPAAIATRDGLGFNTPYNDVWEIDKAQELGFGPDWAMWASPPCPTFSIAVLPVWEAHRGPLEELGYSVWVGYLTSEMYGVPQTRKRAYLIARRDGTQAAPPKPTHSRYYSHTPGRLDEGVLPWMSMAEALGWGMTRRPSPTLTSHLGVTRSPSGTQGAYLDAIRSGGFIFKPVEPKASNVARNRIGSLYAPNTVNMDANEGGLLNSFPDDFPFQGTKTQRDTIVGNAVPVLVARAIIATAPTD